MCGQYSGFLFSGSAEIRVFPCICKVFVSSDIASTSGFLVQLSGGRVVLFSTVIRVSFFFLAVPPSKSASLYSVKGFVFSGSASFLFSGAVFLCSARAL